MIRIAFLDKQKKEAWLPQMFALFHENMHQFINDNRSYETQKANWISEISPALDKDPRQVILCTDDECFVGFLMYYTRHNLLMVEEVQIQRAYQKTSLFPTLCNFLKKNLSDDIQYIEAFAHKENLYSQQLMCKLGIHPIPGQEEFPFVHLRGTIDLARKIFK